MTIKFTKMHGLGNDCIIINALDAPLELAKSTIQLLADRHLGIGCDQILIVTTPHSADADFYCQIFNADGSTAGFSGNCLRCLAYWLYSQKITSKKAFVIETYARKIKALIEKDEQVTLNIGIPDFSPQNIPFMATSQALSYNLETIIGKFTIGAVSVGNPHVVMKVDDISQVDIQKLGPTIEQHSLFPERTNVNFLQILDRNNIRLRTYERGAGETLACGSGSSAAVAVGLIWQLLDENVTVHLPKGTLMVKWQNIATPLLLTGPAALVFNGEWLLA